MKVLEFAACHGFSRPGDLRCRSRCPGRSRPDPSYTGAAASPASFWSRRRTVIEARENRLSNPASRNRLGDIGTGRDSVRVERVGGGRRRPVPGRATPTWAATCER